MGEVPDKEILKMVARTTLRTKVIVVPLLYTFVFNILMVFLLWVYFLFHFYINVRTVLIIVI